MYQFFSTTYFLPKVNNQPCKSLSQGCCKILIHFFQRMEIYQRRQLESALKEFGSADIAEKELFEEKLFRLREMNY